MALPASHACDVTISATPFDAHLVRDLAARIERRLSTTRTGCGVTVSTGDAAALDESASRIVVVLAQRLWGHEAITVADDETLRARARRRKKSIVVVSLDHEPQRAWMMPLSHVDLAAVGVAGVLEFILDAVRAAGGSVSPKEAASPDALAGRHPGWDTPVPYLGQPRAHSALRREFDGICAELEPGFELKKGAVSDHLLELYKLPNRIIARQDGFGVSFSWLAGRTSAVSDGRLMVIEWSGMSEQRGVGAMRSAKAVRECVYTVEATSAEDWCWRAESPNGRAASTPNLVREWIAGARMSADVNQAQVVS
jgi:hypothetical protein